MHDAFEYVIAAIAWRFYSISLSEKESLGADTQTWCDMLNQKLGTEISLPLFESALVQLADRGYLKIINDPYGGIIPDYDANDWSAAFDVDSGDEDKQGLYPISKTLGQKLFERVFGNEKYWQDLKDDDNLEFGSQLALENIPAADRIVTLKHNQSEKIEDPLDEVINIVEQENSINGEDGVRELILGRLRAGRELVRAGVFSLRSLQLTLVVGLQMLTEKYKDHAIGAVAGNLLALVLKELGI